MIENGSEKEVEKENFCLKMENLWLEAISGHIKVSKYYPYWIKSRVRSGQERLQSLTSLWEFVEGRMPEFPVIFTNAVQIFYEKMYYVWGMLNEAFSMQFKIKRKSSLKLKKKT